MQLIALNKFRYDGHQLKAGEKFNTVSDRDGRVLITIGRATSDLEIEIKAPKKKRKYKKREYLRADMRPEL